MITYLNDRTMLNALVGYFRTLAKTGSAGDGMVRRLLMLLFVNEIVNGELNWYVSDEDYRYLRILLYKMSMSCLMPYRAGCADRIQVGDPRTTRGAFRLTEESAARGAEDGTLRITENMTEINTD